MSISVGRQCDLRVCSQANKLTVGIRYCRKSFTANRLLAEFGSSRLRAKYVTLTLYLPVELAYHFRKVAADGGWELGDLRRALILAGLAFRLFRVAENELASETRLTVAFRELTRLTTERVKRPYQIDFGSKRGSWITIRLPERFLRFLSIYARSTGRSRNYALNLFLKAGLLLYMTGYNKFLRTIIAETESRPTASSSFHKTTSETQSR